ncbi:MAG TPA: bestrophin family ion channel [Chitinophaga sp.]|uniref:bestrophin family protein n=1 Tax=Chitinophaga sp. TaxID=1869181 RepID=UPI002DBF515C|nr:bestrophin family ion channel [Chitinophaga sp.]HEU4552141.1 bestrophin family ion channel [Chitinophaga sp.]
MLLKKNIPFAYVFGKIKYELIWISAYAIAVAVVYHNFHASHISIPIAIPAILGTVLSLLLGFRSNQAYERWWEARIVWGAIVNDSRTLTRQLLTFTAFEVETPHEVLSFRDRFVKRQIAWCYSLGQSLRKLNSLQGLDRLIPQREVDYISRYDNKPVALLELHARDLDYALKQGWINRYQQVELDRTLTRLCDSMGKCERIKNTIFPATYSLYIHLTLNLFIVLLPFGLMEFFGIMQVPLVIAIAASFLLIEKMAIHLQDPFENKPTDTPVTTISRNIERDLKQILQDWQLPETQPAERFYIL